MSDKPFLVMSRRPSGIDSVLIKCGTPVEAKLMAEQLQRVLPKDEVVHVDCLREQIKHRGVKK